MNNDAREMNGSKRVPYDGSVRWANYVANLVTGSLTALITAITIVIVVLGGMWLAYTYLPFNVFLIIAVVIVADILLGIAVRAYLRRR